MLTAIWQANDFREHDWICELFDGYIDRHVFDGRNEVVQDDCILFDKFIHAKPLSYYERFRHRSNVFLFHMSDEQYHGGYFAYRNFTGVFRNYWSGVFTDRVTILPLGYSNGVGNEASHKPASQRRYTWSFAGETTRSSRPEMLAALRLIEEHLCHSTDTGNSSALPPAAYRDTLLDTIFSPCPMGRLNLECFRLYEALESGCIPVVEERAFLDYFTGLMGPHPLPSVRSWHQARTMIERLSVDPVRLDSLQAEISYWWGRKKHLLKSQVSQVLTEKKDERTRSSSPTRMSYRMPLWQLHELSRHQSPEALRRRIKIQLQRAVSGRSQRHATSQS